VQRLLRHLAAQREHADAQAAEEDADACVEHLHDHGQDDRLVRELAALVVERVRRDDERRREGEEEQPEAACDREALGELDAQQCQDLAPPERRAGGVRERDRRGAQSDSASEPIRYW
jgi:hypothetical protein